MTTFTVTKLHRGALADCLRCTAGTKIYIYISNNYPKVAIRDALPPACDKNGHLGGFFLCEIEDKGRGRFEPRDLSASRCESLDGTAEELLMPHRAPGAISPPRSPRCGVAQTRPGCNYYTTATRPSLPRARTRKTTGESRVNE